MNKRKIINDPVHGFITIPSDFVYDLITHPWFQRMSRIKQLGLSYLVYPAAQHSRLSHALGALHLMQQALQVLSWKGVAIRAEEAEAAMAAILLHDLGHGPFSHTLEGILVSDMKHEQITAMLIEQMNEQFGGRLELALAMFRSSYSRPFFCQLIASQLDVDRLDYLVRDSFFTGVAEGIIGHDRIIKLMTVEHEELAVDERGIYSIEKFLLSRRLMYWQVYLHKTVLAAESMLIQIMRRARQLLAARSLPCSPALRHLLTTQGMRPTAPHDILDHFVDLDDSDIFQAIKYWRNESDKILSHLCRQLLTRTLFHIELQLEPFTEDRLEQLRQKVMKTWQVGRSEVEFLVTQGTTEQHAYRPGTDFIRIKRRDGRICDVSQVSELFTADALRQPQTKYYVCYPRGVPH